MKPTEFSSNFFRLDKVLYYDNEFAIAHGEWISDKEIVLAVRWNNYPKNQWLKIPVNITKVFLLSLINSDLIDKDIYCYILDELKKINMSKL
jgi:hypothetical protein